MHRLRLKDLVWSCSTPLPFQRLYVGALPCFKPCFRIGSGLALGSFQLSVDKARFNQVEGQQKREMLPKNFCQKETGPRALLCVSPDVVPHTSLSPI